ncbi:hypothetical protein OAU50_08440 [Planctomycetota bacterium]|nr:hypothetical protein [Planctomycetota bacterium]
MKVVNPKELEESLGLLTLAELGFIHRFEVTSALEESATTKAIVIEVCTRPSEDSPRIRFTCANVRAVHLRALGGPFLVSGFCIDHIADRQLENVNWQVSDCEDDALSFQCESIEVQHLT